MRTSSTYKNFRNRCSNCGHRLTMTLPKSTRCRVINGYDGKPENDKPCDCLHHSVIE